MEEEEEKKEAKLKLTMLYWNHRLTCAAYSIYR